MEYEKEGYDLDGVWYLPDFWLPEQDCWVEIKGQVPTKEENVKAEKLVLATQKDVFILFGELMPFRQEYLPGAITIEEAKRLAEETGVLSNEWCGDMKYHGALGHQFTYRNTSGDVYLSDHFHQFTECPFCHRFGITFFGRAQNLPCAKTHEQQWLNYEWGFVDHPDPHAEDWWFKDKCNEDRSPRLIAAYTAARQARFEHGERP